MDGAFRGWRAAPWQLPADLALGLRVGDGGTPPAVETRGPFFLTQRREPTNSLYVSVQRSKTGKGFDGAIREHQASNPHTPIPHRQGEAGWSREIVQDSAADEHVTLPAQTDFDSAAEQVRTGLTVRVP